MKVGQLIKKLQAFPEDLEVWVSDGYNCRFYAGDYYSIELLETDQGKQVVDIGIGGFEIQGEDDE